MSKAVSIKDLEDGKLINKPVHVFGWVKTFRSNRFIALNDGSCCLLYTSPSPRDTNPSRMPSSA